MLCGVGGAPCRYKGADTRNRMTVVPQKALHKSVISGSKGLREDVFYFKQGASCQNLHGRRPNVQRTAPSVNYASTSRAWPGLRRADHFAVRWRGSLFLRQGGTYKFSIISDDGSKLWIDYSLVVRLRGAISLSLLPSFDAGIYGVSITTP